MSAPLKHIFPIDNKAYFTLQLDDRPRSFHNSNVDPKANHHLTIIGEESLYVYLIA